MADQSRPVGAKYKQKPPKLLLTSSSSGEDFLAKQGQGKPPPAKGQTPQTKRAKPPPTPFDRLKSSFEKKDSVVQGVSPPSSRPLANGGSSFARETSMSRRPPPPSPPPTPLQALGSQNVPAALKNQPKSPSPESAWGLADPLLSADSPLAGVQRATSAIISRTESKTIKGRQPQGAAGDVRKGEFQPLSRLLSKRKTGSGGEPAPLKQGDSMLVMSKEEVVIKEKLLLPARSKFVESFIEGPKPSSYQKKGQSKEPSAKGTERKSHMLPELENRELRDVNSDDAWASTPRLPASGQKSKTEALVSRRESQTRDLEFDVFPYSPATSETFKTFPKPAPKPPKARPGHDVKGQAEIPPDILFETTTRPIELQRVLSKRSDLQPQDPFKTAADQGVVRDLEGRLARANERVADLEAQLQKTSLLHREQLERERSQRREELERERSQHRSKLAEAIREANAERQSALDRLRKEADERVEMEAKESRARMEEVQKQALVRQNSMKMRCDASLRELKEQVSLLEKQLKVAQQNFEGEKTQMIKSFEERRKSELHAKNVEVQTREKELKNKEAELIEQQGRVQALTTSVQTLTTSLAQMKELNDISRTATQALEEKTKTQANYIEMLLKRQESMRAQAAKLMPIREAKRLAFRALLKGRAVEMITRACMPTDASLWNKAWAFQQLVCLIGGPRDSQESRQDAIESRLMQFRKEQMFLMAENEKLMAKVAQLQQEGVNQRQSKVKHLPLARGKGRFAARCFEVALLEQELVKESSSGLVVPTHYSKAMQEEEPHVRWLVSAVQHIVNSKMLWAFLRLQKVTTEAESNMTIDKLQKKFNGLRVSAYKEMAARIGLYRIAANMRCYRIRIEFSVLLKLARYAGETWIYSTDDKRLSSRTPKLYGPQNNETRDFNVPLAHQPPYYRQLPSVRSFRGRNVFLPMIERSPPREGYLPHPGYTSTHLTLGVPPVLSKGRPANFSPGIPNAFPSGPYDATQPVDERGAIFRVRGAQQELGRIMMRELRDKNGARIVGKKLPNTSF